MAEDEHHVHRASVGSEAALALGDVIFGNGWNEPVEQDPGKYFANTCQITPGLIFVQKAFLLGLLLGSLFSEGWRRGGQVVSALEFWSRGRWFEPGHCNRVVSLDKKLYSTLSLFTQVYKILMGTGDHNAGG